MLAFEISINGGKKCTTGITGNGLMSAMLTWLQHQSVRDPRDYPHDNKVNFHVSAVCGTEEFSEVGKWLDETLHVGDGITIRVVEVSEVDPVATHNRTTPRNREQSERRYYEQLKRKYKKVNRRWKKSPLG